LEGLRNSFILFFVITAFLLIMNLLIIENSSKIAKKKLINNCLQNLTNLMATFFCWQEYTLCKKIELHIKKWISKNTIPSTSKSATLGTKYENKLLLIFTHIKKSIFQIREKFHNDIICVCIVYILPNSNDRRKIKLFPFGDLEQFRE
jgi:hypothetical protein